MKKLFLCIALVSTGLMVSCVDKNEEVDGDKKPSWLGESIYAELKSPSSSSGLQGTFTTYLKLIDDLNETATLSRTGSKTIFPANDEAFARFFQGNDWGVTSYDQLTTAQKKLLLYSSMIDNALLLGLLPNVSNGTSEPTSGMAIKHATGVSVIDSIEHIFTYDKMPQNNRYWTKYAQKGIDLVRDNTTPMMVHLTRDYMVNNGITTTGENSDFELLTGEPYSEGSVYIFNDKVVAGDVTCQNGYIHQLQDVLVPPGNIAEVIGRDSETTLFAHILDYFAMPYFDQTTTNNYNDWAIANGQPLKDSIFQVRYPSSRSQGAASLNTDPNGASISSTQTLRFDPGWNGYYPGGAYSTGMDYSIMDIGAVFVPEDAVFKQYFLPGGAGAYLIDIYGKKPNTEANLFDNLDSLHVTNPQILTSFVKNLMKSSFIGTVPSKFSSVNNDASENMGLKVSMLKTKADGKRDVKIANNGVVYKLNELFVPDEYQAVLAPSSSYSDMQVMNWAVQDRSVLGLDFKFYLLAMSANYGFFIPDDEAFETYYVDPASLASSQPRVIRFYYDAKSYPQLRADTYNYNMTTNTVGARITSNGSAATFKSQLVDMLNYHTVVLNTGEVLGDNHFYKTKHGGEIYVTGATTGRQVMSGAQIDNGLEPAVIEQVYSEKNGVAFRLDHVIQPTVNSVAQVLGSDDRFSEFFDACTGFNADPDMMTWIGISADPNELGISPQDQYTIFTQTYQKTLGASLDRETGNVKMFNTYNYTLYAPDNAAMQIAYNAGLPRWAEIINDYEAYSQMEADGTATEDDITQKKAELWAKIDVLRDFVRYHFQTTSLYADNTVEADRYSSLCTSEIGVPYEYDIKGGGGKLIVTDLAGVEHTVDANNGSTLVNKMARDYWLGDNSGKVTTRDRATSILTSSFCAVHEITEPFYLSASKTYNGAWRDAAAKKRTLARYLYKKANNKLY